MAPHHVNAMHCTARTVHQRQPPSSCWESECVSNIRILQGLDSLLHNEAACITPQGGPCRLLPVVRRGSARHHP